MAHIKHIYTCPKCEESVTADEKPETCPACNSKFPALGARGFADPTTITEQASRINDEDARVNFLLNMNTEVSNNIMNDALSIMQTISGKKVKASDIRIVMGMAIQIGAIAKQYEEFLKAGGIHTPSLFISGEDADESTTTGNREKTSAPVPVPMFPSMGDTERSGDED